MASVSLGKFYKRLHNSVEVVLNTMLYFKRNFLISLLAKYGIPSIYVSSCFVNRMWSKYAEKATDNGMFFSYGFLAIL